MKYSETQIQQGLSKWFGYNSFLTAQQGIISDLLEGRSILAVMPTGSGKSLCFQLPAMLLEGYTLVVSPMISLMKDQVMQLTQLGIPAAAHNSLQSPEQQARIRADLLGGKLKLLYAAPETLMKPAFIKLLESKPPSLIAIDEAHCISMWGHDFRPEYRQLDTLRRRFGKTPCFALTATAIPKVREDICALLDIPPENQRIESFDRPNLFLAVEPKRESFNRILSFLGRHPNESGIIYCMTRKGVDQLSDKLLGEGYSVLPYHAGLSDEERHRNQEAFINDEVPIMVATIAFGMGINKSNIRFVIHQDLPKSLETYYQEIGRAGRDGLPSSCLLLYSLGDLILLKKIIQASDNPALNDSHKRHLDAMIAYCEHLGCRRTPLLRWFGEDRPQTNCGSCDNCREDQGPKTDVSEQARKFLSTVYRAQEAYSADRIVEILRGSRTKELISAGDDKLSVHGVGNEWKEGNWLNLYQTLKRDGCLGEGYPHFRVILNAKSWEILRGERAVLMPETRLSARLEAPEGAADDELFEELVGLRRRLAQEQGVPPYIIFSDKHLREMTKWYPQSAQAFRQINGVGSFKAEKYGKLFIGKIREYCEPKGIAERDCPEPSSANEKPAAKVSKTQEVAEYLQAGHNLQECMVRFGVQLSTIVEHLQRYLEADGWLDPAILNSFSTLSPEENAKVRECFREHGLSTLSPVHAALNEAFSYNDLKLVRLCMVAELKAAIRRETEEGGGRAE